MKIVEFFKDDNDYNEKSIIGAISFSLMVLTMIVDIITSIIGVDFDINPLIYESFVNITLFSFGIAEVGKVFKATKK